LKQAPSDKYTPEIGFGG